LAVLPAASSTSVIVGGIVPGGGGVPPVVMVPAPVKVRVIVRPLRAPVPVRDGKDPVAPAKLPVPPVTVAEPARGPPVNADNGSFTVPVMVPGPPVVSVMVKGALRFPDESGAREAVALNVPLPILVRVAGPVTEMVAPTLPVALVTFSVVLVVAACAPAPTSSAAKPKIVTIARFIDLLK
jgi:hypothetical protein